MYKFSRMDAKFGEILILPVNYEWVSFENDQTDVINRNKSFLKHISDEYSHDKPSWHLLVQSQ